MELEFENGSCRLNVEDLELLKSQYITRYLDQMTHDMASTILLDMWKFEDFEHLLSILRNLNIECGLDNFASIVKLADYLQIENISLVVSAYRKKCTLALSSGLSKFDRPYMVIVTRLNLNDSCPKSSASIAYDIDVLYQHMLKYINQPMNDIEEIASEMDLDYEDEDAYRGETRPKLNEYFRYVYGNLFQRNRQKDEKTIPYELINFYDVTIKFSDTSKNTIEYNDEFNFETGEHSKKGYVHKHSEYIRPDDSKSPQRNRYKSIIPKDIKQKLLLKFKYNSEDFTVEKISMSFYHERLISPYTHSYKISLFDS